MLASQEHIRACQYEWLIKLLLVGVYSPFDRYLQLSMAVRGRILQHRVVWRWALSCRVLPTYHSFSCISSILNMIHNVSVHKLFQKCCYNTPRVDSSWSQGCKHQMTLFSWSFKDLKPSNQSHQIFCCSYFRIWFRRIEILKQVNNVTIHLLPLST